MLLSLCQPILPFLPSWLQFHSLFWNCQTQSISHQVVLKIPELLCFFIPHVCLFVSFIFHIHILHLIIHIIIPSYCSKSHQLDDSLCLLSSIVNAPLIHVIPLLRYEPTSLWPCVPMSSLPACCRNSNDPKPREERLFPPICSKLDIRSVEFSVLESAESSLSLSLSHSFSLNSLGWSQCVQDFFILTALLLHPLGSLWISNPLPWNTFMPRWYTLALHEWSTTRIDASGSKQNPCPSANL